VHFQRSYFVFENVRYVCRGEGEVRGQSHLGATTVCLRTQGAGRSCMHAHIMYAHTMHVHIMHAHAMDAPTHTMLHAHTMYAHIMHACRPAHCECTYMLPYFREYRVTNETTLDNPEMHALCKCISMRTQTLKTAHYNKKTCLFPAFVHLSLVRADLLVSRPPVLGLTLHRTVQFSVARTPHQLHTRVRAFL